MRARTRVGGLAFISLLLWLHSGSAAEDLRSPPPQPTFGGEKRGSVRAVTVIRGSPASPPAAASAQAKPQIVRAGVIGTGNNLWYVDSDQRIHACWLSGTGYVNSLKVVCTR